MTQAAKPPPCRDTSLPRSVLNAPEAVSPAPRPRYSHGGPQTRPVNTRIIARTEDGPNDSGIVNMALDDQPLARQPRLHVLALGAR